MVAFMIINIRFCNKALAWRGNVDNVKEFVEHECENLTQKMFYVQTGNSAVDSIINTKQKLQKIRE